MSKFFEMSTQFDRQEDFSYPLLIADGPLIERAKWTIALTKAKTVEEALLAPINFTSSWGGESNTPTPEFSDWPGSIFLLPICSRRMWSVMHPFCPSTGWIQLPPDANGLAMEWGAIAPHVVVDVQLTPSPWPHFFSIKTRESYPLYAVSEELKSALKLANLVGVVFSPLDPHKRR